MKKYHSPEEFMNNLSAKEKEIFEELRSYIFESNATLTENLKWNAPNYVYNGQDRITFNTMNKNKSIRIILHKGAKEKENKNKKPIMDNYGSLIFWNSNIRGTLEFESIDQVKAQHQKIVAALKKWLSL